MSFADKVRKHCLDTYVIPGRKKGETYIKIRSGDVHKDLNFSNKYPLVCSAIGSNTFEKFASVKRISIEGPLNGANTLFTFELT